MKRFIIFAATVCGLASLTAVAQQKVQSTVVNADGTVTFNYLNPSAKAVQVDVQFAGRHDMVKDADGMWTATLGPAAPDMYPYQFVVDGVSVMDDENPQFFPNEGFKNSILDIPGKDAPLIHAMQNVPHGRVEYVRYFSNAIKGYNNAIVYTPPTYYNKEGRGKKYPVFYLISGTTDTEEVYYKVGRMNVIADNLIAQGKAREMIIVLPYGNPSKLMSAPNTMSAPGAPRTPGFAMVDFFSNDLVNDLMPYVESHYRTIADRDHRAIGGFSRGGNQGLMNGLTNLDKFSYLCSYSSFTQTNIPNVYDNAADTNKKIHLFWSGVGTDDFLYGNARDYTAFLDEKGITCVKEYTTDKFGHTWMNAKHFLDKTMRLLFDEDASAAAMKAAQPTKAKTGDEQQFTPGVMARLFPRQVVSPEIKADGVTFRISAPNAALVQIEGEMLGKPMAMEKDADGVWSITLTNLKKDVFCYNFIVDGTKVADAQNMYLEPASGFKRSILDLAATPDAQIEYTPVQYATDNLHDGTFHTHAFVGTTSDAAARQGNRTIVLVADGNDTCESWHKVAKANELLDQMVAAGQCKPCNIIMTDKAEGWNDALTIIRSSDYKTWAERRAAFVEALKKPNKR